jgi:hypothetical protein
MRIAMCFALIVATSGAAAQAPTPTPAPRPSAPTPAPAAARRAPPARAGVAITITDPQGATLSGVRVEVLGASDRAGDTNASGQINFPGMQAGTYRVRFTGSTVITFEREVTLRAGQTTTLDITLNPAPPPPEPPPAAPPEPVAAPPPPMGPVGAPRSLSIVELIERQLIPGDEPRRETLVACSGNTRTTLVQLNQEQPARLYDDAEVTYYVVAGEGAVRVTERDTALAAGSFVSIPRGTSHALLRRGRRPLIVLVTLSGTPCEEAR